MQALMATRTSGTHCNFCISGCCAAAKLVVAAIARQTNTANFAAVDLIMVSLRQMLVQIIAPKAGAAPSARHRASRDAGRAISVAYRVRVLLRLTVPPEGPVRVPVC